MGISPRDCGPGGQWLGFIYFLSGGELASWGFVLEKKEKQSIDEITNCLGDNEDSQQDQEKLFPLQSRSAYDYCPTRYSTQPEG